jgi:DNA-binding CsgD family transcriptional regulator
LKAKRSTRENGLKTSIFRSEAPNRATPITAVPASNRAHSTQLVAEAQRLEEVFVRTNPAPALSEEEIAYDESLKQNEYLDAARKAREDVFADPRSPEDAKRARLRAEEEVCAEDAQHSEVSKSVLGKKKQDFSGWFDAAQLTERQRDCVSLKLEYGWPVVRIAHSLGIVRKTVDEHIAAAKKKINIAGLNDKRAKDRAKSGIL